MTRRDVADILEAARVASRYYSLTGDRHECLCLLAQGQDWHVFLSERSRRHEERVFDGEDPACVYFLKRLFQLISTV